jgi:hypothetical protein
MQNLRGVPDRSCRALNRTGFLMFSALLGMAATPVALADTAAKAFFDSLHRLCGTRFEGAMTFPAEGQDAFAGKLLVAQVETCTDSEIRIPFAVGDDTSRTWIISRTAGGLQLQHDHRHADGTEDAISMYGGKSRSRGSATEQSFAADAHTAKLIPEAATNVWTISLADDGERLVYALQRNDKPRFKAELRRVESPASVPGH